MDAQKIKQAIEVAKANPDSTFATELRKRIESGTLDTQLHEAGLSQYASKPPESNMAMDMAKGLYQSAVGSLLVKPAARATEAVTRLVAPESEAAKGFDIIEQEGGQRVLGVDVPAVKQFGQGAGRQITGEGLESASYLFPFGKAAAAGKAITGSKIAGQALSGAAGGYTADVAFGLQDQDQTLEQALTPGLGAGIGTAIPLAGPALRGATRAVTRTPAVEETLGRILQGKTKDIGIGKKALQAIDTTGVKSRADLSKILGQEMNTRMAEVDAVLARDPNKYTIEQVIVEKLDNAGKPVKVDFVGSALKDLEELYATSGDDVALSNLKNTAQKIRTEGLTRQEMNQLARQYSEEFSSKAFSQTGEPLTSVSAQRAENIRKGLKEVVRGSDDIGKEAGEIDRMYSAMSNTKRLIDKGVEGVNKLKQRVNERTLLEKAGRGVMNTLNAISGGSLKGAASAIFPSNVGLKTMNWLDLEKSLANDLKILEKANATKSESELIKFLKDNASKFKFPGDAAVDDITKSTKDTVKSIRVRKGSQGK